ADARRGPRLRSRPRPVDRDPHGPCRPADLQRSRPHAVGTTQRRRRRHVLRIRNGKDRLEEEPMNETAVAVTDVAAIDHDEAMALAATEYTRFSALVDSLAGADWDAPTDCTEWTVRDMVLHVLGTAEGSAS